jgi:6-pyruvoyltetrahydropterin/6-carboxytetrahydropterin synthase
LNDRPLFKNDPSAERIAKFIYDESVKKMRESGLTAGLLHAVEVYETPASMARYEPGE